MFYLSGNRTNVYNAFYYKGILSVINGIIFYRRTLITAQKMKFFIKYFFCKCDQISSFLRIWSHLLKKSLMENFIFGAVSFSQIRVLFSLFLVVLLSSDYQRKWHTATHDLISPLPWKQSRFSLWYSCCSCRKDQGRIISSLGFIRNTVFKL